MAAECKFLGLQHGLDLVNALVPFIVIIDQKSWDYKTIVIWCRGDLKFLAIDTRNLG